MIKHILFIILFFGGSYYFWNTRPVHHEPGEVAPNKPKQTLAYGVSDIEFQNYKLTPVSSFKATVRVLSKRKYFDDMQAEVAPYDFIVGWGPMSDSRNLDYLLVKQNDRSFYWEMAKPPIPQREMVTHTANIRLIVPDKEVQDKLDEVRIGHIITLDGYLVNVKSEAEGWMVYTSTSRYDIGPDAAEILWVTDFNIQM